MSARLITHCGAHQVTREEIARVATPDRTQTWVPIPHATLLDGVQHALEGAGLSVVHEAHALARDGNRFFGLLELRDPTATDGDFGLVVGVRNSHDRSFPAGLVVGSNVFVCDNLAFSGEVRLDRKHTVHIARDLPQLIASAVGRLGTLRHHQEERFATYRQHEIGDATAHDLVVRALDARVIPAARVPLVLKEWRTPRHAEFKEGGKTVWRLLNAFSESWKGGSLDLLPRRSQALHGLLDGACGLAALAA